MPSLIDYKEGVGQCVKTFPLDYKEDIAECLAYKLQVMPCPDITKNVEGR